MPTIHTLLTPSDLTTLLTPSSTPLPVLIDFTATWCGPCQQIAPLFHSLADQYTGRMLFAQVDVDRAQELAAMFGVSAMPTFVCLKGGQEVGRVRGAAGEQLKRLVSTHALPPPAAAAAAAAAPTTTSAPAASASASSSTTATAATTTTTKDTSNPELADAVSLLQFLDPTQLNCLNESDSHGVRSILSNKGKNTRGSGKWLESDADEQLLLNIYFNQAVRVRAIVLQTQEPEKGPKKLKLFINKPALGFEDVEDAEEPEAAQVLELSKENLEGKAVGLRTVRFTRVTSLHIFVAENQGGEDTTRIDVLDILGTPIETTKMGDFKKMSDD